MLRPDWVADATLDDSGRDRDVAALHQGFLRTASRTGARMPLGAGEVSIERCGAVWQVRSKPGLIKAALRVNATGAWADQVARQAGARTVGLQPMRRTAVRLPAA